MAAKHGTANHHNQRRQGSSADQGALRRPETRCCLARVVISDLKTRMPDRLFYS